MTNWSNPTTASSYVNYTSEFAARDVSLALQFDSVLVADTNVPTNAVRWNSTSNLWQRWNGTTWNALAATYGISISGNAATATTAGACSGTAANASQLGGVSPSGYAPAAGNSGQTFSVAAATVGGHAINLTQGDGRYLGLTATAAKALLLNTARTIDGTSFDGGGNINLPILQNSKSAAYTCVIGDANKHLYHPSADTTARTFTIPANSAVAFTIGTTLTFVNDSGAGVITIAINTDTLMLAGQGTTGSRSLAATGMATALKITATKWIISGAGLT